MADDDRRVEARLNLVGKGMGTTPERIFELQQRADEIEKLSRRKPAQTFSKVIADKGSGHSTRAENNKEKRRRVLPKKGPKPNLVHPSQRDAYGREEENKDTVILKG